MRLERKVIQQKSEAQNLESYTAMISHEFRTPLATALMFIDIILGTMTDEFCIKYLNAIKSSLHMLLSLVSDMLDLKMIKEDKFMTNIKQFCPNQVLAFVKDMFSLQAKSQHIELRFKSVDAWHLLTNIDNRESYDLLPEKPLPQDLDGDELRFKQVLINIIKNAIKFTRRGFVQVLAGYDE